MTNRVRVRVGLLGVAAACGSAACGGGLSLLQDPGADAEIVFPLSVGRQAQQPYPETSVDIVLAEASALMRRVDPGCEDNATAVQFTRIGDVAGLSVAPAIVTTEAQLDALFSQPQDIKVVNMMIGVCGVPANQAATILGCATNGGSAVVIASARADVWAHEWGHVLGLRHRSDCRRNLMNAVGGQTDAVNSYERVVFLTARRGVLDVGLPEIRQPNQGVVELQRGPGESQRDWLERLVSDRYLAGIPAELLLDLDASASADLRALLANQQFAEHRANVVRAMGFTRDAALSDILMDELKVVGDVDEGSFAAISESFLALGRLLGHDPSGAIFDWLIEGSDPAAWAARAPAWTYLGLPAEERDVLLARLSILALSVSETDRALAHLQALRDQGRRFISQYDILRDQVTEGIARLERTGRFGPGFALDRQP